MQGTGVGSVMAPGEGETMGYTRFLGKDLTNDHPISLTYNQALVTADGEMREPMPRPAATRSRSAMATMLRKKPALFATPATVAH
jgi:hypothetical protein